MAESSSYSEKDGSFIQLSKSSQLLARSARCLPQHHRLKPKFEEIMGDLDAEITEMKHGPEGSRPTSADPMSIDPPASLGQQPSTTPNDLKVPSSPSPNIARPKPERRPTPDFFPKIKKGPPLAKFTPQQHWAIQNAGRRKPSQPRGTHSRPSRIEKKRKPKPELTLGQKGLRTIRKERKERAKMFF
ncbi:hypothetical protein FIE12Z_3614 [Fusarium flagelliforme]|uniref:Uncharacterized protein n=1 Tax=Fusarium flagelliforme TaxID=2675880 RepID=A0A395MVY7_9HYPO|nr:hypothetical protein FIE12Z_3614 [Fusarium flagelliforme]